MELTQDQLALLAEQLTNSQIAPTPQVEVLGRSLGNGEINGLLAFNDAVTGSNLTNSIGSKLNNQQQQFNKLNNVNPLGIALQDIEKTRLAEEAQLRKDIQQQFGNELALEKQAQGQVNADRAFEFNQDKFEEQKRNAKFNRGQTAANNKLTRQLKTLQIEKAEAINNGSFSGNAKADNKFIQSVLKDANKQFEKFSDVSGDIVNIKRTIESNRVEQFEKILGTFNKVIGGDNRLSDDDAKRLNNVGLVKQGQRWIDTGSGRPVTEFTNTQREELLALVDRKVSIYSDQINSTMNNYWQGLQDSGLDSSVTNFETVRKGFTDRIKKITTANEGGANNNSKGLSFSERIKAERARRKK